MEWILLFYDLMIMYAQVDKDYDGSVLQTVLMLTYKYNYMNISERKELKTELCEMFAFYSNNATAVVLKKNAILDGLLKLTKGVSDIIQCFLKKFIFIFVQ
jgi:hypothetical protein